MRFTAKEQIEAFGNILKHETVGKTQLIDDLVRLALIGFEHKEKVIDEWVEHYRNTGREA